MIPHRSESEEWLTKYIGTTLFWRVGCLKMDIVDYLESNDTGHLLNALSDVPEIVSAIISELEKEWLK